MYQEIFNEMYRDPYKVNTSKKKEDADNEKKEEVDYRNYRNETSLQLVTANDARHMTTNPNPHIQNCPKCTRWRLMNL